MKWPRCQVEGHLDISTWTRWRKLTKKNHRLPKVYYWHRGKNAWNTITKASYILGLSRFLWNLWGFRWMVSTPGEANNDKTASKSKGSVIQPISCLIIRCILILELHENSAEFRFVQKVRMSLFTIAISKQCSDIVWEWTIARTTVNHDKTRGSEIGAINGLGIFYLRTAFTRPISMGMVDDIQFTQVDLNCRCWMDRFLPYESLKT